MDESWSLSGILDRMDLMIIGGIETVFGAMTTTLYDVFIDAAVIATAWLILTTFTPLGKRSIPEFFFKLFIIMLTTGILLNWDYVNIFVIDFFYRWPTAIAGIAIERLTGSTLDSPNEVFERLATMAVKMGFMIKGHGDGYVDIIINAFYAAAFTYVIAKLILQGLIPLISAKVTIMLMASITIIIAIAVLFDRGRNMAIGWLQVLITNALIILFIYLLISIFSVVVMGFFAYFRSVDDYTIVIMVAFGFGMFVVAIRHAVLNAEVAARNLGNAYGMGSPDVGARAAWGKFVQGSKEAAFGKPKASVSGA